jgi:RES domain-containing protein
VPVDAGTIATLAAAHYEDSAFRHVAAGFPDPLSGQGARIHGGRYNPPDSFEVLYLCTTRPCAVAELRHLGERHVIGLEGLLPRTLHRYDIRLTGVLDLTSPAVVAALEIEPGQLISPDWSLPHRVGVIAHSLGWQAILAPSALGVDEILAVFPAHCPGGSVTARLIETWAVRDDVTS